MSEPIIEDETSKPECDYLELLDKAPTDKEGQLGLAREVFELTRNKDPLLKDTILNDVNKRLSHFTKRELEHVRSVTEGIRSTDYESSVKGNKREVTNAAFALATGISVVDTPKDRIDPPLLVRAVEDSIEDLFLDNYSEPYVLVREGDESILYHPDEKGNEFKDYVRYLAHQIQGYPREDVLSSIVPHIAMRARRSKKFRELADRTKDDGQGGIFVRIGANRMISVSKDAITVEKDRGLFRRPAHLAELEIDLDGDESDLEEFVSMLPLQEIDKPIAKMLLVSLFVPKISKPIVLSIGPEGSGKTTIGRAFKLILDPPVSPIETYGDKMPKDDKDFTTIAKHHEVLIFDNESSLSYEQQDNLARLCTGSTRASRGLYTNDSLVFTSLKRPVFVNSISLSNLRPDFMDRSLKLDPVPIPPEKRMSETEYYGKLRSIAPRIRGACLNILQKALGLKDEVKPSKMRLTDFSRWAQTVGIALGTSADSAQALLEHKFNEQKQESIEQSIVASAIVRFMEDRSEFTFTASELLDALQLQEFGEQRRNVKGDQFTEVNRNKIPRTWPKDATRLSQELKRVSSILSSIGIFYDEAPRTGTARRKRLRKTETSQYRIEPPKPKCTREAIYAFVEAQESCLTSDVIDHFGDQAEPFVQTMLREGDLSEYQSGRLKILDR